MRLPKPAFRHPPEVYLAIVREHRDSPVQMAERLQACGWTLADAAWAAVNWDLRTMAAAVANERATRNTKPTSLSDGDLTNLREEINAAQKSALPSRPKKTTWIVRTTPRLRCSHRQKVEPSPLPFLKMLYRLNESRNPVQRALEATEGWLALSAAQAALEALAAPEPASQTNPAVLRQRTRALVALGRVGEAKEIVRCLARLAPAWRLALLEDPALEPLWT